MHRGRRPWSDQTAQPSIAEAASAAPPIVQPTATRSRAQEDAHRISAAIRTTSGRRYRVIYRRPDHQQTSKRGFRTKKDAELFLAATEVAMVQGRFVAPEKGPCHALRVARHLAR